MRLKLSGFYYMYLLPHRSVHMSQHYHNLNALYSVFVMVFYMRIMSAGFLWLYIYLVRSFATKPDQHEDTRSIRLQISFLDSVL